MPPFNNNDESLSKCPAELFGYLMPMGFLFVPAIDATATRSLRCALTVTNALAFGVAATMLVPSLPVQARVNRALFSPSFFTRSVGDGGRIDAPRPRHVLARPRRALTCPPPPPPRQSQRAARVAL